MIDDFAQVVAALDLVLDLAEDLTDFVFDGVRAGGFLFEAMQVGEEFSIDEGDQVIAGQRFVVVDLAVFVLGGGPAIPAIGFVEDMVVFFPFELGFGRLVVFEGVEVLEEEEPGSLFGVIEFARAPRVFPEHVVDIFEGKFEHGKSASKDVDSGPKWYPIRWGCGTKPAGGGLGISMPLSFSCRTNADGSQGREKGFISCQGMIGGRGRFSGTRVIDCAIPNVGVSFR